LVALGRREPKPVIIPELAELQKGHD
jgi:hypothetical protein